MYKLYILLQLMSVTVHSKQLSIQHLNDDPILMIKERDCKIQSGSIKVIHPIDLLMIENAIENVTKTSYRSLLPSNPLTNIIKFKTQKLYTSLYNIKPKMYRRKRWDTLGTVWKFIAGNPDARDLSIINSTMNELIEQNNDQFLVNHHLQERISLLTDTINNITTNSYLNQIALKEIDMIITLTNIDIIIDLLDGIQDAITLSKSSLVTNKLFSLREMSTIRNLLSDQGVHIDYPEEALQFVIPKIAVSKTNLLYILNVPLLENKTSHIVKIYPLTINNKKLAYTPSHAIIREKNIFTTSKPEDFVQRFSFINEVQDTCLKFMISGKQSQCISVLDEKTDQRLISENSILISNAKNQTLQSNCGPDNRTLTGNFLITFSNCTVKFNNQSFRNSEMYGNLEIFKRAFHNLNIRWETNKILNVEHISNETLINRKKLQHIYLEHANLKFSMWTIFGSLSMSTVCGIIIFIIVILFGKCSFTIKKTSAQTGRSEIRGGAVTNGIGNTTNSLIADAHPVMHQHAVAEKAENNKVTPSRQTPDFAETWNVYRGIAESANSVAQPRPLASTSGTYQFSL